MYFTIGKLLKIKSSIILKVYISKQFGLFIDIDGVVTRGRDVLPPAKKAFETMIDSSKLLNQPLVFLTNSGTSSTEEKSNYLTKLLDIHVNPSQIIMSYRPLDLFKKFSTKNTLISGQGPIENIATIMGIKNLITIEQLSKSYPLLDMMANARREIIVKDNMKSILPRIEAIVLFGEPVNWETSLQLIIDVLLTDGYIDKKFEMFPYPHIPIISCNSDFIWMAQWKNPRLGHGAFLSCLESLYKKMTGKELIYSAILGKPNVLNYLYAEKILYENAKKINQHHHSNPSNIQTIYAIGDNIESDIVGGNIYNKLLDKKIEKSRTQHSDFSYQHLLHDKNYVDLVDWTQLSDLDTSHVTQCKTILVQTGVFHSNLDEEREKAYKLSYNHRDTKADPSMKRADYVVKDLMEALKLIRKIEA